MKTLHAWECVFSPKMNCFLCRSELEKLDYFCRKNCSYDVFFEMNCQNVADCEIGTLLFGELLPKRHYQLVYDHL
jgi:hypothetical protein